MDRPRCDTCRYWMLINKEEDILIGCCILSPPAYIGPRDDIHDAEDPAWWVHPSTVGTDSCAQHPDFLAFAANYTPVRDP